LPDPGVIAWHRTASFLLSLASLDI